jgi:ABC-type transport system involved in cytochrome bd biosynthesis fused ATPase/permease subunit
MTKKHLLIMLACCLIPVAALLAIFVFNIQLNIVLLIILVLVCPLSHLLLMKYAGPDHRTLPPSIRKDQQIIEE